MSSIQKLLDSYRTTKSGQSTTTGKASDNDEIVMDLKHGVFAITDHFNSKPSMQQSSMDPIEAQLKIRYHIRRLKIARKQMLLQKRKSGWS